MEGDVRDLSMFPDKIFGSAFASHIIEHLPSVADAELAMSELHRVADKVFIVAPSKASILAWVWPDHYLWVSETDGEVDFKQRGSVE